jgi:uncharacterized protein (TIGR02246 family)
MAAAALALGLVTQSSNGDIMSSESAILANIEGMTEAFEAGDIPGILKHYEDGAVVVSQPGMPASGTPALTELFQRFIAVDPKFSFHEHEVIEAGDIALHAARWTMTGKASDGTAIEDGGLSLAILRKQSDGRWLMVIDNPYGDHVMRGQ